MKFRPGQRVRVGCGKNVTDLEGAVGTVVGAVLDSDMYIVNVPAAVEPGKHAFIWTVAIHEDDLSTVDCYDVTTWDNCAWRPTAQET